MNSANSYNICPRCGNSNSLSAKYCSRCGGQLKVPEEPVVCHKCHTHNSPMANYCRNCGTELKVGWETKICPKCGKEVDAHDNVCACGYSFVTLQQTAPAKVPVSSAKLPEVSKNTKSKKIYNTKGGRGWAIASLILMLLFAYYLLCPAVLNGTPLRLTALNNLDKGITSSAESALYGGNYIGMLVSGIINGGLLSNGISSVMIAALVVITAVTMVVQLIEYIVRSVNGKRPKHIGWFYLIVGILSVVVAGLILLFNTISVGEGFLQTIASAFLLPEGFTLGYAIWGIPVYYLFFFLLSLGFRAKKLKEK